MFKIKFKGLAVAVTVGILCGLAAYTLVPKEYELSGMFKIARVNNVIFGDFLEVQKVMDDLSQATPGVGLRYFRVDTFQFLLKFRSRDLTRLQQAPNDLLKKYEENYKTKYSEQVTPLFSQLEEVTQNVKNLNSLVTGVKIGENRPLADNFYYYSLQQILVYLNIEHANLQKTLDSDNTGFFEFHVQGTSSAPVFPKLPSFILIGIFAAILGYLVVQRLRGSI